MRNRLRAEAPFPASPAGLYVRFRAPADLLSVVGSRFLVRPLKMVKGDRARLVAETMAVALSQAFGELRQGNVVDLKKALEATHSVGRRDLTLGEVSLPNGTVLRNVQIDNGQDARQFQAMVDDASRAIAPHVVKAPVGAGLPAKAAPKKVSLPPHQIAVHLGDLERAKREKITVLDSRHTLRLFAGIVGDKPVGELGADDCRLFFDEVSKHRQRLSVFINFLLDNDHVQKNPLKGTDKVSKFDTEDDTGRAFTEAELDAIFEPVALAKWPAKYPHRLWAPLIGLYTGARITEGSLLYVDDIATEHGAPGFHIRKGKPGQKLKNKSSLRFIPIAQPLLDAGFVAFVEDMKAAGQERLFPHLPNTDGNGFGRHMSRHFSTYIKSRDVTDTGMGFHAFRHTMTMRLDRAGVGHGTIARITGHGLSGGILPKFYINSPSLPERVSALAKFEGGVVIPTYQRGKFAVILRIPRKASRQKF
ncbi:integrase [Luteibacter sp. 621]|uniref:integrase n=1 Tax=Luteibacter sp. 621 TaxID=3373916 RepID=UPI003D25576A